MIFSFIAASLMTYVSTWPDGKVLGKQQKLSKRDLPISEAKSEEKAEGNQLEVKSGSEGCANSVEKNEKVEVSVPVNEGNDKSTNNASV